MSARFRFKSQDEVRFNWNLAEEMGEGWEGSEDVGVLEGCCDRSGRVLDVWCKGMDGWMSSFLLSRACVEFL